MSKERLLHFSSLEGNHDETGCFKSVHVRIIQFLNDSLNFGKKALEMGRKDPRKVVYALKSGFALGLASLFIFWTHPINFAQFSIWGILTVVVMFEFSIGATLIKGFNRGLGTFCAGMLAFFFAELSLLAGKWEKIVIVISFFITGFLSSYLRLYPTMAPYDYGYRVFALTYCILMVAGNRTREYTVAILTRLVLIAVGACICFIVNICIYPIWAGDDLHHLVVNNFMELATSLEGCVNAYLKYADHNRNSTRFVISQAPGDQYLGYKSVIESANREQSLLGFAVWEPPHGRYRALPNPWRSYVKLSGAVRHCAYTVMALHGCILAEIQAPPEKRQVFRSQLQRVSSEGARVLRELGNKIEKMEKLESDHTILKQVHEAGEELQRTIDQRSFLLVNSETWEIGNHPSKNPSAADFGDLQDYENLPLGFKSLSETAIYIKSPADLLTAPRLQIDKDFSKENLRKLAPWPSWVSFEGDDLIKEDEIKTYQSASSLSLATFASLLIEFVARLQNVVDCFEELSEEAGFKDPNIVLLKRSNVGLWKRIFS